MRSAVEKLGVKSAAEMVAYLRGEVERLYRETLRDPSKATEFLATVALFQRAVEVEERHETNVVLS